MAETLCAQIEQLPHALFVFSHVVLTTDDLKGQAMASVDVAVAAYEFRRAYQIPAECIQAVID